MQLSDKITSREQLLAAVPPGALATIGSTHWLDGASEFRYLPVSLPCIRANAEYDFGIRVTEAVDVQPGHMWWAVREALRIYYKVYPEPTPVVQWLTANPGSVFPGHHYVHISKDDPSLIAFTPDSDAGAADKQVRMSLGRYLRRFITGLTDQQIQTLEAAHRADLSNEYELATGGDISRLYQEAGTSGVGSCMSHATSGSTWPELHKLKLHPTMAYDAPGFALAVMRNTKGAIAARCLCWINPADPTDKRMMRIYGDRALERRLKRTGFDYKPFYGAVLKEFKLPSLGPNAVVLPYIDGLQGRQGDDTVQVVRRPDGLHMVSLDDRGTLENLAYADGLGGNLYTTAKVTGGYVTLTLLPASVGRYTSVLSGNEFDSVTNPHVLYLSAVDGEPGKAAASECAALPVAYMLHKGDQVTVRTPEGLPVFDHDGVRWVESGGARKLTGYVRLDAALYPDADGWRRRFDTVEASNVRDDGALDFDDAASRILGTDARLVAHMRDGAPRTAFVHHSAVRPEWERVADLGSQRLFAGPGVKVELTDTKRKVIVGLHEVVRLMDGTVTYLRNAVQVTALGTRVYMRRVEADACMNMPALPPDHEVFARRASGTWRDLETAERRMWDAYVAGKFHLDGTGTTVVFGRTYQATSPMQAMAMAMGPECTAQQVLDTWPATSARVAQALANSVRNMHSLRAKVAAALAALPSLPPVDDGTTATVELRRGDLVRVMRSYERGIDPPWTDAWVDTMDEMIGGVHTVRSVTSDGSSVSLRYEEVDGNYWFPRCVLSPVTTAAPTEVVPVTVTA